MPLRAGISTVAVYRADPINWGREIKRYLPLPIFVMGNFLCGVPCRGSHGSAHNRVGSDRGPRPGEDSEEEERGRTREENVTRLGPEARGPVLPTT